ncbi:MAG: VCBS repeat-containing protein [Acidobacteriota bacterium]|nr:VCBS repeat-containing protein [Acidobacteriota bacterium]MDH3530688.1 VCBS repeat-containing protein [Acidobacteriota bacterium]
MRRFLESSCKALVLIFALTGLTATSYSQIALRDALDIDGDDKADYTVFRPSNNVWYTLQSGGGFMFQQFGLSASDFPAPGDYDGDGKGDIAVWRDENGAWYWLNSSDSTFSAVTFGVTGDEPVGRDYDGDGKTDLAVVRRSNGNMIWYVLRSSDGLFSAQAFGFNTDYTAPGDYDGDGKFDFAIQRPGTSPGEQAVFYIQKSGGGVDIFPWGFGDDLVVPGDYDGDGKTDVAVVREGQPGFENYLIWYVLKSSDQGLIARVFGLLNTDLTTQNDFDGDGATDIAIWRDSERNYYVLQTTNGSLAVTHWGLSTDYPVATYDTH